MKPASLLFLAGLLACTASAENITLTDPSLENPFGGTQGLVASGWWTFSNLYSVGGEAVNNDGFWNMAGTDGNNAAYAIQINANDGGSIYQTVELDAGITYTFTVAVGMSAATPKSDGKFALVFFNNNFSALLAESVGVISTRGSFTDYSVQFTPAATGIYQVGMRNRGYVPGTGANNNQSTIFFDNARLTRPGGIGYPAAVDVSSPNPAANQEFDLIIENRSAALQLEIDEVSVHGPDAKHFTVLSPATPESPILVAPGADGAIGLRFDPRGRSASIQATLEIRSNDPLSPLRLIPITGLVRAPWKPDPRPPTEPYLPAPVPPGPATATVTSDTAVLANSAIAATWRETGGVWMLNDATNHFTGQSLAPATPAPLFTVTLADGSSLGPADMSPNGPPQLSTIAANPGAIRHIEKLPGKQVAIEFTSAAKNLRVRWRAELRDGCHFIRQEAEISALDATPVPLASVAMVSMATDGFTIRGTVDGSPALSNDFFVAHESPVAKTTTLAAGSPTVIGTWNVSGITTAWSAVETYDVTTWAGSGPLTVRFDYQGGPHRLNIDGVELLENGVVVDDDIHFGYAGLPSVNHIYQVEAPAYDPGKTYSLRCQLFINENNSNSSGSIVLPDVPGPLSLTSGVTGQQVVTNTAPALHTSVLGTIIPGQQRRSFLAYLESVRARPYRQYLHYNSWLDVSWELNGASIMNSANTLASMEGHIDQLIAPYNEPYDGFVFDDGWDDWNSLWDFDLSTFPDRFVPMDNLAVANGTSIGAWLSPFGGYGAARNARIAYGQSQVPPYETNDGGFSLAGPNYYTAFRNRCLQMIADYDYSYFKFDGIGEGNGASGAGAAFFPDIAAMLRLIDELRTARGDLFINLTVGSWPSPFWLHSVDSIWRAGADMGLRGTGNNHERWITYRDSETYTNVVGRAPLYPLNSLMIHGIAWANQGPANDPAFNSASFKSDVRAYFGSGLNLQELYLSPEKLSPDDWKNLAEGIKWSRENEPILADTRWIGGDPGAGQIYGWAAWRPDKGLLTLRNPSATPASITLTLAEAFELPPDAAAAYYLKSPWIEDAADTPLLQAATAGIPLTLAPYEVLTLEATTSPPPAWHANAAYREWALALPAGSRTPGDPFGRSGISNLLAFTTGLDPVEVSGWPVLPMATRITDGTIELQYLARQNPGSLQLVPQVSTNLAHWHEGPAHFTESERIPIGNGTERIRARLSETYLDAPRAFVRLAARQQP